jgi:hypothetical protein
MNKVTLRIISYFAQLSFPPVGNPFEPLFGKEGKGEILGKDTKERFRASRNDEQ